MITSNAKVKIVHGMKRRERLGYTSTEMADRILDGHIRGRRSRRKWLCIRGAKSKHDGCESLYVVLGDTLDTSVEVSRFSSIPIAPVRPQSTEYEKNECVISRGDAATSSNGSPRLIVAEAAKWPSLPLFLF